jgi:hypothetical protein
MTVTARRAAILAASLLAALALPACGGSPEKEALRTYEASIEKPMEEDGKVAARLKDFREDLLTNSASAEEMAAYGKAEAAPFYARFQEAAAKAPAEAPRLAKVHAGLLEYIGHRAAYLAAIDGFLAAQQGEGMDRLHRAQGAWDASIEELRAKTGGQIADTGIAEALNTRVKFMKNVYEPFQTGKIPVADVEAAVRGQLLPLLQTVAERTKGNRTAEGGPGAVSRWAAAELAFFQELAATLPLQEVVRKNAVASQKEWDAAGESREAFLAGLRAYRDSLR